MASLVPASDDPGLGSHQTATATAPGIGHRDCVLDCTPVTVTGHCAAPRSCITAADLGRPER